MKRLLSTIALVSAASAASAAVPGRGPGQVWPIKDTGAMHLAQAAPALGAEFYTTPDNCTYRRTQAPGYPPMWIIIRNPHHIGRPDAPRHCPGTL
ncbi:hypothetical protein [Pseudoprimorskyibacter insulae]|uniref:Uncharacterized protein n=1 Tax=Pseudoprimorskyibacter insulae TaxID=1695997 RepID=A0A2R8B0T5_9RHOB|nr:hypothetical protein [Pseudoprimorskyibacter insulae]SPF81850.1 hypothetical protein PRI8871_03675 [Pseudoprimorskyibacter insulae]